MSDHAQKPQKNGESTNSQKPNEDEKKERSRPSESHKINSESEKIISLKSTVELSDHAQKPEKNGESKNSQELNEDEKKENSRPSESYKRNSESEKRISLKSTIESLKNENLNEASSSKLSDPNLKSKYNDNLDDAHSESSLSLTKSEMAIILEAKEKISESEQSSESLVTPAKVTDIKDNSSKNVSLHTIIDSSKYELLSEKHKRFESIVELNEKFKQQVDLQNNVQYTEPGKKEQKDDDNKSKEIGKSKKYGYLYIGSESSISSKNHVQFKSETKQSDKASKKRIKIKNIFRPSQKEITLDKGHSDLVKQDASFSNTSKGHINSENQVTSKTSSKSYDKPINWPTKHRYLIMATGEEARSFDFKSLRPLQKTSSIIESTSHLVRGCFGGGIISMHQAYHNGGLIVSLVLNVVIALIVGYCIYMLVKSAQRMYGKLKVHSLSYQDLAEAAVATGPFDCIRRFDRCFSLMVTVVSAMHWFGACCVYQVMIARTLQQLVERRSNANYRDFEVKTGLSIRVYLAIVLVPCILLCMIRSIKYLAPFSLIVDVYIVTVSVATIHYARLYRLEDPKTLLELPLSFKSFDALFGFIGACFFSMDGVMLSLSIENCMTEPEQFSEVVFAGISIVAGMGMIVGFFGFWGFQDQVMSPVTLNFPHHDLFALTLKSFLAIILLLMFALNFCVTFELVWKFLKRHHSYKQFWIWERLYRALFIVGLTIISTTLPNVFGFIGLLGSFCIMNIGVIYPAFITFLLDYTDPGLGFLKWRLWKFVILTFLALVVFAVGTYINAKHVLIAVF